MSKKVVHVVGCGTIGEPLIGLLVKNREPLGIDEVTFSKRTPRPDERAFVNRLVHSGAILAVAQERRGAFEELGFAPGSNEEDALARASVVIDCTPAGSKHKAEVYAHLDGPRGFLAQGSEFGFGKPYARGINDAALDPDADRFLHIVSCNTHNIGALVRTLAFDDGRSRLDNGRIVCMRRANDASRDCDFVPSPTVGRHDDARFGTHHARDAHALFATLGHDLPLWSSALKLPTQYMHALWFGLELDRETSLDEVRERLAADPHVALTHKRSANRVFSFGRDHGSYGRILNQTVVPVDTLAVRDGREVVGMCFTPQDGNSLLSSVAATLWLLGPESYEERLGVLQPFLFDEV